MSEYLQTNDNKIDRRTVLRGAAGLFGLVALSACGGESGANLENIAITGNTISQGVDPEVCILSYPGATVLNIVGNDPHRVVRVDQNNDGSFEYENAAGSAPGLQYNEGPKGLDGRPLWEKPIQDRVCY